MPAQSKGEKLGGGTKGLGMKKKKPPKVHKIKK